VGRGDRTRPAARHRPVPRDLRGHGCFGGQQAIQWAIQHPDQVGRAVVITTTPATSAHSIAIFTVMRRLIRGDPAWRGGDYYGESFPAAGLGAAIAAAVPLWMSPEAM